MATSIIWTKSTASSDVRSKLAISFVVAIIYAILRAKRTIIIRAYAPMTKLDKSFSFGKSYFQTSCVT